MRRSDATSVEVAVLTPDLQVLARHSETIDVRDGPGRVLSRMRTPVRELLGRGGMLDMRQEDPNHLIHAPIDGPRMILTRNSPWLSDAGRRACRLPAGHPEALIEAFATLYVGVAADIRSRLDHGTPASREEADYPRIEDGARGVRFIEKTVESAASDRKWTAMR